MAKSILTFKSNLPNLTVLKLSSQDIEGIKENVRKKIRQAPMMFIGMQVVIDLSDFDSENTLSLGLSELKEFLRGESINPVAAMSNRHEIQKLAVECGIGALPVLSLVKNSTNIKDNFDLVEETKENKTPPTSPNSAEQKIIEGHHEEPRKVFENNDVDLEQSQATEKKTSDDADVSNNSKTVKHSIRSGQSIYAQGDLTVIGSVSPGAEVIADGNIHIYGTLRGRAIAGAHGNIKASIFCQKLEAELVAIAGNYTQLEDANNDYLGKIVQISLDKEKICFFPL